MPKRMTTDDAALAPNWRTVLLGDAVVGIVLIVVAAVVTVMWSPLVGIFVAGAASANLAGLARRYRRWQRLRADAGL